jgi:hypothetical protein
MVVSAMCLLTKFFPSVRYVLLRWTALRLAIDNLWGGDTSIQKAEALEQEILNWFHKGRGNCPKPVLGDKKR